MAIKDWNDPKTAPKDGTVFLALIMGSTKEKDTWPDVLYRNDAGLFCSRGFAIRDDLTVLGWQPVPAYPIKNIMAKLCGVTNKEIRFARDFPDNPLTDNPGNMPKGE